MKDISGRRFGNLVAVRSTGRRSDAGNLIWLAVCDCGEEREEDGRNLRCGVVTSCKTCGRKRTIQAVTTHALSGSAEHRIWTGIKTRCCNAHHASHANYGARGISICERWTVFENFIQDMGIRPSPHHSIERINNDGNYEPSNCRWATKTEQALNRRTNSLLEFEGETKPLSVWAKERGVKYDTLRARVNVYGITGPALFEQNLRKRRV